jgi:hypothetical protein
MAPKKREIEIISDEDSPADAANKRVRTEISSGSEDDSVATVEINEQRITNILMGDLETEEQAENAFTELALPVFATAVTMPVRKRKRRSPRFENT